MPATAGMFDIDTNTGLMAGARLVDSPNQDCRPPGVIADLIVVHNISLPPGEYGGPWIEALFCNQLPPAQHPYFATIAHLQVSSHLLIRRDGELVQFVPFERRAWHAGASVYRGRERCNDFSIGIELEGSDDEPFELVQYLSLSRAIAALCAAYPSLSRDRLTGHSDIAPGRKTDPGPYFDWQQLNGLLDLDMAASA
ncbi:MAG: 1,6-anhydro-N-acetylmuramyl-L-alanine amidase AmpD [Steroidobacteraceae bacterium]